MKSYIFRECPFLHFLLQPFIASIKGYFDASWKLSIKGFQFFDFATTKYDFSLTVDYFSYAFSFIGVIIIRSFFVCCETLQRLLSRILKSYSISCQPGVTTFTAP